jgi:hypothetical protein
MIKQATILVGHSGAGKTTYGKFLERTQNIKMISWDRVCYCNMNDPNSQERAFERIREFATDHENIVLDGFVYTKTMIENFVYTFEIKPKICFMLAPLWLIAFRVCKCSNNGVISPDLITRSYFDLFQLYKNYECVFINSCDYDYLTIPIEDEEGFAKYWGEMNKRYTPEDRQALVGEIAECIVDSNSYDVKYQDIELYDVQFEGHTKSHLSWDKVKYMTRWLNKRVLEIGCNHGYFCFKAAEFGASEVTGLEYDKRIFQSAKRIRDCRQSPVGFILGDAREKIWLPKRDITLVLNIYHYFKEVKNFVDNIFANTDEVIFEINPEDVEMVKGQAWVRGFVMAPKFNGPSHRIDCVTKSNREYHKAVNYRKLGYI